MIRFFKGVLLGIFLSTFNQVSSAQEKVIRFENIFSGKHIELKTSDDIHVRFTVHDTSDLKFDIRVSDVTLTGKIESIDDTSILLVTKNKTFDRISVIVPVTSIEAFRKYSPARPVIKAATGVASAAIAMLATLQISNSEEVLSWTNAGIAVGTTSAAFMAQKLFFDKMKYYMVEGWKARVILKPRKRC